MKISVNWLKEFVDVDVSADEIAKALVSVGIEVAAITPRVIPSGIIVAHVKSVGPHPKADKLHICRVDTGAAELTIVCGAPNAREGMKTALATLGTKIGTIEIKKAVLRGQESDGMLCSERELGISEDHSGIMDLPAECEVGKMMNTYFKDDTVIEIEITPNRGDCLSIQGVAREIAAFYGKPLKRPARKPKENGGNIAEHISVQIDNPERCPRYMGSLIQNVQLGPSPLWMKDRLSLCGLRAINNVVDVTNYILLAYGQPMHSFDYNRIRGKKIIVKTTDTDIFYNTLDGTERPLKKGDLLISDAEGPVALAGIMGGAGSEIADTTNAVFLECAFFDPAGIRMTSKRLGLSTDSSYRFERGVDLHSGLEDALNEATELIRELAQGTVVSGLVDTYPKKPAQKHVTLRPSRVKILLGVEIPADDIKRYLEGLGMPCISSGNDTLVFDVPHFRHDITIEADLIEEVGRLYGYDRIPSSTSATVSLLKAPVTVEKAMDTIRKSLAFCGMNETVSNSMLSEKINLLIAPDISPVSLMNPLSPDMAQMRTNLLGSLLQALVQNINHKNLNNRLFELGTVFSKDPSSPTPAQERTHIGLLIEGDYIGKTWNSQATPVSFYLIKGLLDAFSMHAGIGTLAYNRDLGGHTCFDEESAGITAGSQITGACGKITSRILRQYDIKSTVFYAVLDVTDFISQEKSTPRYVQLPRFPGLERDFCFVMPIGFESAKVSQTIYGLSDLVEEVVPFDVYGGEKLGVGLKSIAYSVRFRSKEKTLADKEAETLSSLIIDAMKTKFSISLRT